MADINLVDIYGLLMVCMFLFLFGLIGYVASSHYKFSEIILWKYRLCSATISFFSVYLMYFIFSMISHINAIEVDGLSSSSVGFLTIEIALLFLVMIMGFWLYILIPLTSDLYTLYKRYKENKAKPFENPI